MSCLKVLANPEDLLMEHPPAPSSYVYVVYAQHTPRIQSPLFQ